MTDAGAFGAVVDELGFAIVSGRMPAGHVESVEAIVARTGVSRSVVREATRVLVAAGLFRASRRVGLRVLPASDWDTLDTRVIRWRLASGPTAAAAQVRELRDLRLAIEPEAASLAAARRTDEEATRLAAAARELRDAVSSAAFLEADQRFHRLVLSASRNSMFARLHSVVDEALRERASRGAETFPPSARHVELHAAIAAAISAGDAGEAGTAARLLIDEHGSAR